MFVAEQAAYHLSRDVKARQGRLCCRRCGTRDESAHQHRPPACRSRSVAPVRVWRTPRSPSCVCIVGAARGVAVSDQLPASGELLRPRVCCFRVVLSECFVYRLMQDFELIFVDVIGRAYDGSHCSSENTDCEHVVEGDAKSDGRLEHTGD